MTKKVFSLFVLLVSLFQLFSQEMGTVKGVLLNQDKKPIELANIFLLEDQTISTNTNAGGEYSLKVPSGKTFTLVYTYLTKEIGRKIINLKSAETKQIDFKLVQKETELRGVEIRDKSTREQASTFEIKVKEINLPDASGGGIEGIVAAQALGFNRTNELSSNYSVRGGNFDENLVYVNDFEVYRPFLMRSGQQEGLTFPNPNLVSNIKFSSGGFQTKYGDKLSSVMDVQYKRPKRWAGSVYGSMLGFGGHIEGCSKDKRFTLLAGVRQKNSSYILGSLDTKGQYNPNFVDGQLFATYQISEKWLVELISNFAMNKFEFTPNSRTTKFGTIQDVKQVEMAFEGSEKDHYLSVMNGLSLNFMPKENLKFKLLSSVYTNREAEQFDILTDYRIGDVETDQSKSNYGKVTSYRGIGGLQNWARNYLNTDIFYAGTRGSWFKKGHNLQWGLDYKHEIIHDKMSEWDRVDSAGYTLPYNGAVKTFNGDSMPLYSTAELKMQRLLKSSFQLITNRISGFIQDTWRFGDSSKFSLNYGIRFSFSDVNKEPVFCPRIQFSYKPKGKKDLMLTVAGGTYYQPPFYREMRNQQGVVNTALRSQKSAHAVIGLNYAFQAWNRPFSFVTEVYYKYLWDLVPFEYDNALIRYDGVNKAKGYSAGIDLRLNGELAKGAESWISLSFMNTRNVIEGASKTVYLDSNGKQVSVVNQLTQPTIKDTVTQPVGYQPRPTDQLVLCNIFFTDYIPKFPYVRLNMNLIFGSGIPTKAPQAGYYTNAQRLPFYRRVDLGFAGKLWDPTWQKTKKTKVGQGITSVWLSLDVLNVMGIGNTISYLYIKDFYNNQYAVPNYLSARRLNVKLVVNFGM